MKKNNFFKSERWNAGIQNAFDGAVAGVDVEGAEPEFINGVGRLVADVALRHYDRRIRAYFARFGVDIGDDVLTVESIREKVRAATGLEIEELTPQGIADALERPLAAAVSELMGFEITSVFDQGQFKEQVKAHVLARLIDGEGGGVLRGQTLHRLREAATYARAGAGPAERRRLLNRAYQRKFRKSNRQTWTGRR